MSLKVMHWAWTVALPPAPKLVLMALADEADDHGFCFPSVPHLAAKCSIGERTVQRILRRLTSDCFVAIEQRFRKDRARTSNGYRLAIGHPLSNCHRPPDSAVTGAVTPVAGGRCHRSHRGGDTSDGVTTTDPCINPKPQPPRDTGGGGTNTATPRDVRGGCHLDFPKAISAAQQHALATQLGRLSRDTAQQVLDELAGRLFVGQVRDPVRYCAGLVERLIRGEFRPELGIAVARQREAERQREAVRQERTPLKDEMVDAAIDRLPEEVRSSLERMRRRSEAEPR